MPRKLKSEHDLRTWIVEQVRKSPHCPDFGGQFTIVRLRPTSSSDVTWDISKVTDAQDWSRDCTDVFTRMVREAQRRFDLQ